MHPQQTNGLATASLVLSIVGIVVGWCLFLVPNVLGIVFGHMALSRARNGAPGHGQAVAGLAVGYGFLALVALGGVIALTTTR